MTIRIEEGKFYRTRGGHRVGPMRPSGLDDGRYPWIGRDNEGDSDETYTASGRFDANRRDETGMDLVAEWIDEPDAEGWIAWSGGECPVAKGTVVEYRCGDHIEDFEDFKDDAGALRWEWVNSGKDDDIVAYRVVKPSEHALDAVGLTKVRGSSSLYAAANLVVEDGIVVKTRDGLVGARASKEDVENADLVVVRGVVAKGGHSALRVSCLNGEALDKLDAEMRKPGPIIPLDTTTVLMGPNDERLIVADLLAAIRPLIMDLKTLDRHGGCKQVIERAEQAAADAEGLGIRAQSFAERDLLEANNRYLERARKAEESADYARQEIKQLRHAADVLTDERNHWRSEAHETSCQLDAVANRSDEERGMVWLIQQLGAHQRALAAILPYAESRAEDMDEEAGDVETLRHREVGDARELADKAVAAVDAAKKLLGRV